MGRRGRFSVMFSGLVHEMDGVGAGSVIVVGDWSDILSSSALRMMSSLVLLTRVARLAL